MSSRVALGLDFGTELVRALAVDTQTGDELSEAVCPYAHGVLVDTLPSGSPLEHDSALQHPQDYLDGALDVIRETLKHVDASSIIGIGVDFTACTMLPIQQDGTPLMRSDAFKNNPQAWVKLWKHHAAQPEADRVTQLAQDRQEAFLPYVGGTVSSEWMLPKCFETLNKAPEVYAAADLFVEAGDWIVQCLTDQVTRNACAAGYKGLWTDSQGFVSDDFLTTLHPQLSDLNSKWSTRVLAPGQQAGTVSASFAAQSGLAAGTPVSAATIDAHSGVPGMGVSEAGVLSIIMGTSACHMLLAEDLKLFEGYAGVAKDGILEGYYGYESGQAAVGDLFAWFAKTFLQNAGDDPFSQLSVQAEALAPGASGLVALDWHNGNRSPLMNADLSGLIMGLSLNTQPHEVYRALVEGTAFGTRQIIDNFTTHDVPISRLTVCGGLTKDRFLLQTLADITGRQIDVAASGQAVALGAAIFGALAAGQQGGGFDTVSEAVPSMTRNPVASLTPRAQTREIYDTLYAVYNQLHHHFGVQQTALMKQLKTIKKNSKTKDQQHVQGL